MICGNCGIQIEPDGRVFYCKTYSENICEGCSKEMWGPNNDWLVHSDCLVEVDQ